MLRRRRMGADASFFWSLLLFLYCSLSFITVIGAAANVLDLSHQPHLTTKEVSAALLQHLSPSSEADDEVILIDVSSSNLGDAGLRGILESSSLSHDAMDPTISSSPPRTVVDFKAQMNRLTANGVTAFLNRLTRDDSTGINRTNEDDSEPARRGPTGSLRSLDLGWNRLYHAEGNNNKVFHKALQELLANNSTSTDCLQRVSLSCTGLGPATCRALAKGLLARFESEETGNNSTNHRPILSLCLSCNPDIGDAGTAALAAAIRNIVLRSGNLLILDTLDLSACDIGDIGAEALALALEDASVPAIRRLILSHNQISDQGALSLGRALQNHQQPGRAVDMAIDLSNNPKITDRGIATLLAAIEKGTLQDLTLRSCSIHADGADLVGKTLRAFCTTRSTNSSSSSSNNNRRSVTIDLSGNPLGLLRGKSKSESGMGGKYSASLLKSKASATASAYVTQGLSFLKKGLGGVGSSSAESDDEEEKQHAFANDRPDESAKKSDHKRCGFKALANSFIGNEPLQQIVSANGGERKILLGLRRTFCDTAGADALAAMLVSVNDDLKGVELKLELDLNPVVEDEAVAALKGDNAELLTEMADRHTQAMEIILKAQERAAEAAKLMAARRFAAAATPEDFSDGFGVPEYEGNEGEWDSDADYEDDME